MQLDCVQRTNMEVIILFRQKPYSYHECFDVTSMNITSPCLATSRGNKYLLTIRDHFTKCAEIYPIPDKTAQVCAIIYETKVVTLHGIGYRLKQGQAFMSFLFQETCKILGIHTTRTSSYQPESN
jgi:hypothetical protein